VLGEAKPVDVTSILQYGSILIVALVGLGLGIWWIRRWLFSAGESGGEELWSLHQLRQWRAAGQISQAEFERLRAEMIGRVRSDSADAAGNGAEDPSATQIEVKREDEAGR
jgi:hypothetical protein